MRKTCATALIAVGLGLATSIGAGAETQIAIDVAGRWQGTSSGTERGACGAVTFDVEVVGGRIGGSAHSRIDDDKQADWAIFGLIDSAGRVTLETSRLAEPIKRRFEHVVWTGRLDGGHMQLTQAAGAACSTQRTLDLSRP